MSDKEILACPRCGNTDLKHVSPGQGFDFGVPQSRVGCKKCGWIGFPVLFKNTEEYEKFLRFKKKSGED